MQEFCPLCSENGITTKLKAFQLSFEEAVLMCSNANCLWPVDRQELVFINRSIGKNWSKSWEEIAAENLKISSPVDKTVPNGLPVFTEDDVSNGLAAFTEDGISNGLTAFTEDDVSNVLTVFTEDNVSNGLTAFAENDVSNGLTAFTEDNVSNGLTALAEDNTCTEDFTTISKPCDFPLNTNISNESNSASLPVDSEPVKRKAGALPTKKHINLDDSSIIDKRSVNMGTAVSRNFTSLVNNSVPAKANGLSSNLFRLSKVSKGFNLKSKVLKRFRGKSEPYKKFSLNDLQKVKSTSTAKEAELDLGSTNQEKNDKNSNQLSNTVSNSENQASSDSSSNVSCNSDGLKNVEQELNLDELLNSYCNEVSTKTDAENTDDYDWIESLLV